MTTSLSSWADRLEAVIDAADSDLVTRVRVVRETDSTQDAAYQACSQRPGLVLVTGRQLRGRGRLGRAWSDAQGKGLAMSFVIRPETVGPLLSLRAGLAACATSELCLNQKCSLRWPNDVLEPGQRGRKLAGVLTEVRGSLAVVGIGLNVLQTDKDWPDDLRGSAVSLRQLGSNRSRLETACLLVESFLSTMKQDTAAVLNQWGEREWLIGRRCTFLVDTRTVAGQVEEMTPDGSILIVDDSGRIEHLNAAIVSLVHDPDIHHQTRPSMQPD